MQLMSNLLCNRNTFSLTRDLKYAGFMISKFLNLDTRYMNTYGLGNL